MANLKYTYQPDKNGVIRKYILVHGKYGEHYRLFNPPLERTEGQISQGKRYKYLSEKWDTLTEKEANLWSLGSKDPDNVRKCTYSSYIDGRTMFFHLNSNLLEAGIPIYKRFIKLSIPQSIVKIESGNEFS